MKQVLLSISAFVMAASAIAQTSDHHKWYVSAGVGTLGNNLLLPHPTFNNGSLIARPLPAFNLSAKRFFSSSFAVGITGAFYKYDNIQSYKRLTNEAVPDTARAYEVSTGREGKYLKTYSISLECMKVYKRFDDVSIILYGTAGAGITHTTGYDLHDGSSYFPNSNLIVLNCLYYPQTPINENKFIADIHPIGIRGGNRLCWYGELGYGYKGIVNVGLGYKL